LSEKDGSTFFLAPCCGSRFQPARIVSPERPYARNKKTAKETDFKILDLAHHFLYTGSDRVGLLELKNKLVESGKLAVSQSSSVAIGEQATVFFDPCRSTCLYCSL
jgi:hypothetical protein